MHPASTAHSKLSTEERAETGITDEVVQVLVGLEPRYEIIRDIQPVLE